MHLINNLLRDKTCSRMKASASFNFTVPCHTDIDPFLEWFGFSVLSFDISTNFWLFANSLRLLAQHSTLNKRISFFLCFINTSILDVIAMTPPMESSTLSTTSKKTESGTGNMNVKVSLLYPQLWPR